MKNNSLLIWPCVALMFSSCSLFQRHDTVETVEVSAANPAPAEAKPTTLKKTITDEDLRKNQDDKELKKRVVVLPFIDKKGNLEPSVLKNAQNSFMDSLNSSGEMIALDSSVLKLDLSKYIKNNTYDMKAIAKDIQNAGVSCLLESRIINLRFKGEDESKVDNSSSLKTRVVSFEAVVQARLVNIRSEQELFNTVKTVNIEDEAARVPENVSSENFFKRNTELSEIIIKDAFLDYNTKLVESLKLISWEGRIAALQGERIYLNVGQISGVQLGDILKVVDDGSEIYDTELGYHLGKVPGKVKGTLEIVGFFGQDGAVSVIHSGAGFKENDRVEIYQ
jgi:hypothetical protein